MDNREAAGLWGDQLEAVTVVQGGGDDGLVLEELAESGTLRGEVLGTSGLQLLLLLAVCVSYWLCDLGQVI